MNQDHEQVNGDWLMEAGVRAWKIGPDVAI